MNNKLIFWILIGILIFLEIFAELSLKKWAENNGYAYLIGGIVLYSLIAVGFGFALKNSDKLTIANSVWQLSALIVISLVGIFIYKDKLTVIQIIGLCMGVIAIILMAI